MQAVEVTGGRTQALDLLLDDEVRVWRGLDPVRHLRTVEPLVVRDFEARPAIDSSHSLPARVLARIRRGQSGLQNGRGLADLSDHDSLPKVDREVGCLRDADRGKN